MTLMKPRRGTHSDLDKLNILIWWIKKKKNWIMHGKKKKIKLLVELVTSDSWIHQRKTIVFSLFLPKKKKKRWWWLVQNILNLEQSWRYRNMFRRSWALQRATRQNGGYTAEITISPGTLNQDKKVCSTLNVSIGPWTPENIKARTSR